ncbi:PIN domain-containing protein [[Clostridium] innocuum]|nr:PIN domain-containing protein [[Clostridium] innocuum]
MQWCKRMIKYPLSVTIDTNVFEANKFDFGNDSTMRLLVKNVQNGKIKLVLSNIVISEVEKHICRCVDDLCGKARKLRKEYLDILPEQYLADIGMGIYVQIPDKKTAQQSAKATFAKFLEDCKVERLDTSDINLEQILEDYFAVRPPFENSEKKRKEFPDAFIAQEIKNRFDNNEVVAIVSQDNGFKTACTRSKNHLFFSSIGELLNELSKNEEEYAAALNLIKNNNDSIVQTIKREIDDSCIEVYGLSYDQDGIVEGYDYNEIYLDRYDLSGMRIHTIDDIDENIITASLWIYGTMDVDCYYDDIDNAFWDSEENEYFGVKTIHILEKHNAKFACRIEFNSKTKEIRVLPFKIILGGDSRKSRAVIDDEHEALYYREHEDEEREIYGFLPLSQYSNMLEDDLNDSSMAKKIIELFKQYNDISSCYEELAYVYDEIYTQMQEELNEDDIQAIIAALSFDKSIPIDFSGKDSDDLFNAIRECVDDKVDMASNRMERNLPDCIEYGENINILGTNCRVYTLSLDELHGTPEAGSEEQIEVSLSLDEEKIAIGHVKLIVGYLNFDEDGGASDGIEDSIDYEVNDVLNALENLIFDLKDELVKEQKLAKSFKKCFEAENE